MSASGQTSITSLPFSATGELDATSVSQTHITIQYNYTAYDVYMISLEVGEALDIVLNSSSNADFDLIFYLPENGQIGDFMSSTGATADEHLWVSAEESGLHYIIVAAYQGQGSYTIEVTESETNPFDFLTVIFMGVIGIVSTLVISTLLYRRFRRKPGNYGSKERYLKIEDLDDTEEHFIDLPRLTSSDHAKPPPVLPRASVKPVMESKPVQYSSDSENVIINIPLTSTKRVGIQYCQNCGAPIKDNIKICPYCGENN